MTPTSTDRFGARAAAAAARGQGLFVPFLVVGDPDPELSLTLARDLVDAGADALELGFAFSDPPADGPVIQAADQRALAAGMTVGGAFDWIHRLRSHTDVPVSLLVYYNLVLQHGVERFYARAAEVGVDAVLVADLPPEHAGSAVGSAREHGVATVFLASELSTPARLRRIAAVCRGYVYALARVGVTGARTDVQDGLADALGRMRAALDLPLLVGFGISTPDHVRAARRAGAQGVIVGSALVRHIEAHLDEPPAMRRALTQHARALAAAAKEPLSC